MKYIYPAFFYEEENGYSVIFPDWSCGTCGDTLQQAHDMAVDFLYTVISSELEDGNTLPKPSNMANIQPATDIEYKSVFSSLISVDVKEYEKHLVSQKKSIRKNVTIPAWLAEKADEHHINYSSVLQQALCKELDEVIA